MSLLSGDTVAAVIAFASCLYPLADNLVLRREICGWGGDGDDVSSRRRARERGGEEREAEKSAPQNQKIEERSGQGDVYTSEPGFV